LIPALERKWGVHFAMGGTGQIVKGLIRLFKENGGKLYLNSEVKRILISGQKFEGIQLENDLCYFADALVSNADFADVHLRLIDPDYRKKYTDKKIKSLHYSMSSIILFFGFKRSKDLDILHHNIILSEAYKGLLDSIFKNKELHSEFSQYLHIPSISDPSMAPEGHHVAYTLIPVPNLSSDIDWAAIKDEFAEKIIQFLDEKAYIPDLRKNLTKMKIFTPLDFKSELNSYLGTGWGVEPRLTQSATFRPHNRSEEIENFYLVGASTQPGAGVPGVLMTAKVTEKLIKEDFNLA
jgi:phytoene desaturase